MYNIVISLCYNYNMEHDYDLHANDRAVEVGQRAVDGELVTHEYIFLSCHCLTLSKIEIDSPHYYNKRRIVRRQLDLDTII